MKSLLGDSVDAWREFGDANSLCPQGTHRCSLSPEDTSAHGQDSHTGSQALCHHTPSCQMGRTFQLPMPDPDHSAAIVHQAVKILGTGYNALEGNGKILL